MDPITGQPLVQLRYSIAEASSFSGSYEPQNILYNRPHDIKSRWTGAAVAAMAAAAPSSSTATPVGTGNETPTAAQGTSPTARDGGNGGVYTTTGRGNIVGGGSGGVGGSGGGASSSGGTVRLGSASSTAGAGASGASDKQYIILKLHSLSVLRKIHFGKFYKPHPCNLKDFKVYGSVSTRDPNSKAWVRILRGGLKNDHVPEMFETRWTTAEGVPFPCRYVKLVPLATHLPNYNFSVWYIALEGVSDPRIVGQVSSAFHEHRESVTIRLILKHLRSRAYHSAFRILLESSKLDSQALDSATALAPSTGVRRPFEQPMITQLFHALMQGSWDVAEVCLERAAWGGDASVQSALPTSSAAGSGDSDEAFGRGSELSISVTTAASLLASYVDRAVPKPVWRQLLATDQSGDSPSGRGGHQMELDSDKGILWLFGGWDGSKDLADLWAYYIRENRWRCVSRDVRQQGGPSPRSCHKMVFDPRTGFLYVLGKYVDYDKPPSRNPSPRPAAAAEGGSTNSTATRGLFLPRFPGATIADSPGSTGPSTDASRDELFTSNRGGHMRLAGRHGASGADEHTSSSAETMFDGRSAAAAHSSAPPATGYESDFYRFSTRSERWDRLSLDTHAEGGPKLVFDHQMLIDPETQLLYVFGGRVAHPDANKMELSGMWRYDVIQRSWTFLFNDDTHPHSRIPSRVGHTMLLDTPKRGSLAGKRILWVLAGQRGVNYLADMWTYQLNTGAVREVSRDYSLASNGGGPEGGFTQRATIDSETREIHLFSGLVRRSKSRGERVKSAFWVYHIDRNDWRLVYQHGGAGSVHRLRDATDDDGGGSGGGGGSNEAGMSADGEEDVTREIHEPGRGPTQAFPIVSPSDVSGDGAGSGDVMMSTMDALPVGGGAQRSNAIEMEPRPRFAAQMGYDHKRRLFYIFGGNPAEGNPAVRLDDLWSLELVRPSVAEVLRKAKFKLRQQRFLEMAHDVDGGGGAAGMGAMQALIYLQTQVSQVVNHDVAEESQAFRKLMSHLLHAGSGSGGGGGGGGGAGTGAGAGGAGEASTIRSAVETTYDGSSPWMSPMPGHSNANTSAEPGILSSPLPPPRLDETVTPSPAADPQSDSDGDSDMLSASQVLPSIATSGGGRGGGGSLGVAGAPTGGSATGAASVLSSGGMSVSARQLASEGQPSTLYRQRYQLFRTLCEYFPSDAVEPNVDLLDCIEISKLSF